VNHEIEAQRAFERSDMTAALYWGLRGLLEGRQGDWPTVRLAAAAAATIGPAEAVRLLEEWLDDARGANYRHALVSSHYDADTLDRGYEARRLLRPAKAGEQLEPWYLMNEVRLLYALGLRDEAAELLGQRSVLLDSPVTAWPLIEVVMRRGADTPDELEAVERGLRVAPALDHEAMLVLVEFGARMGATVGRDRLDTQWHEYAEQARVAYDAHPLRAALARAENLERGSLETSGLEEVIAAAISDNRPLAVSRLGDGEGRVLADLTPFPRLKQEAARRLRYQWFWNSADVPPDPAADLRDALGDTDVLGFNPAFRVAFEYRNSLIGYLGALTANEACAEQAGRGAHLTRNYLAVELNSSGALARLGRAARAVDVIGPHTTAPPAAVGDVPVRVLRVPSEGHPLVMEASISEPHWPDAFARVREEIVRGGAPLTYVGAGLLGKTYCAEVRRAGRVAVDIGSVVDTWVGLKTR
jgi:hypothetical protein